MATVKKDPQAPKVKKTGQTAKPKATEKTHEKSVETAVKKTAKAPAKKPAQNKSTAAAKAAVETPAPPKPQPQAVNASEPMSGEKSNSEYYVIRTIQKITENCSAALSDYNENIKRAVETGMELGKGTVEAIGTFMGDQKSLISKIPGMEKVVAKLTEGDHPSKSMAQTLKKAVTDPAKKAEFLVTTILLKAAEETASTMKEYNEKYVKKTMEYSTDFVADIGNVASMAMGSLAETGKKFVANLAVLETIENTLDSKMGSVSTKLSLPGKSDIKKLTKAMDVFNNKMKALLAGKQES